MSERYDDKSPQEQEDLDNAMMRIDPAGHMRAGFLYFFPRLEEVRNMDEDEVPSDMSDAWVYKDHRFVEAMREAYEKFEEAAEALAIFTASERKVEEIRELIGHEVSRMLVARNQIASATTLTIADFDREGPTS